MKLKANWLEEYSAAESVDFLRELALTHACEAGKRGEEVARLIRRDQLAALCAIEVDYERDGNVWELLHLRQALAFFTKLEDLDIGVDKEQAAFQTFGWAEDRCRETNRVFRLWHRGEISFPPRVAAAFHRAQQEIAKVLGPVPSLNKLGLRFGKGATTSTKKRWASVPEKLGGKVACSEDLFPMAARLLAEVPAWLETLSVLDRTDEDGAEWAQVPVEIHEGSLEFVPKNAKTFRAIVTEPVLNGVFQMSLGDWMVKRCMANGLDLTDQTANQRAAMEGSLTGDLATLDQKSASDLLARELAFSLLPLDWACLLDKARTGKIRYRGQTIRLEKFSSMGNGFTFPLESLIFWALARAAAGKPEKVLAYGDDVVCATEDVQAVREVYHYAGFVVNESKSYSTGPFRESCGKDFISGIDIRPFYQKKLVSGQSLFVLHNFYVRHRDSERAAKVLNWIHPVLRIWGPDGYGDGHLLDLETGSLRRKASHVRRGWGGYVFDTFTVRPRRDVRPNRPGDCVLPQYSVYRRSAEHLVPLFRAAGKRLVELVAASQAGAPVASMAHERFVAAVHRGHGQLDEVTPIPLVESEGTLVKAAALPLPEREYKRISIYTFG